MASVKQNKVSRLIHKEVGKIFNLQARDLFGGRFITVTVVRMSPDLSVAKIYLSLLGSKDTEGTLELINSTKSKIRHLLALETKNQMRKIPELIFYIDDSFDYAENIDRLLNDD
ncbi:MAG: 30S ribosome-binding factor RbfA [Flavobacteriales bacterium]|nr:30S ribosome-binding factor RbfA [Flavobacteriales bacterium]